MGQQLGKRYCFSAGVYGDPAQKAGVAKGQSAIYSDAYRRRLPYAAGRLRKARKQGFELICNRKSFRNRRAEYRLVRTHYRLRYGAWASYRALGEFCQSRGIRKPNYKSFALLFSLRRLHRRNRPMAAGNLFLRICIEFSFTHRYADMLPAFQAKRLSPSGYPCITGAAAATVAVCIPSFTVIFCISLFSLFLFLPFTIF